MNAASLVQSILRVSALSKSVLSRSSGVSRALIDDYAKGLRQPSLLQLQRLATAAGVDLDISLAARPKPLPPEFIGVLEFGELFPRRDPAPLMNIGPIWRRSEERTYA